MAVPTNPISLWSQYLAARAAVAGMHAVSLESNLTLARGLAHVIERVDRRHRERARAAIVQAFPELPAREVDRIVRGSFEHFLQLLVETFYLPRALHEDSFGRCITLRNMHETLALMNRGQPLITLTGHLGNWEILGYFVAMLGYRISAIARPIDNPLVNDWLLGVRQKRGLEVITKWDATDRMLEVLDAGGTLGFIADQNAGSRGMYVPFFGRLASTYKSIGLLAVSRNIPIVCGYARRLSKSFRYELGTVDIIHPHDWADRRDPVYYVTARYVRALETAVRYMPEQYVWMHRRWKTRPMWEEQGKPMPANLRRNLEELPWMTPQEMARIEASSKLGWAPPTSG